MYSDLEGNGYNNYADNNGYSRFYSERYGEDWKKYGQEILNLINEVLVVYCCEHNWNFICTTNPYMYIHSISEDDIDKAGQGGKGYYRELKLIEIYGYCNLQSIKNPTVSYTWYTLPKPTWQGENAWWEPSDFLVTKYQPELALAASFDVVKTPTIDFQYKFICM